MNAQDHFAHSQNTLPSAEATRFAQDSEKLLESAVLSNLELTPEERIDAHENARELAADLQAAGRGLRAGS